MRLYKAVLIEDGSTLVTGGHPLNVRSLMENHSNYHVLTHGKDYKIVRDLEAEAHVKEMADKAKCICNTDKICPVHGN